MSGLASSRRSALRASVASRRPPFCLCYGCATFSMRMARFRRFHILPTHLSLSPPPVRIGGRRFGFAVRFSAAWFALAVLLALLLYLDGWVQDGVREPGGGRARHGLGHAAGGQAAFTLDNIDLRSLAAIDVPGGESQPYGGAHAGP